MSQPNIILIMTDQQRFDTISALGADKYITPNLDRLAREGMIFDNCFCVSPTCMPSRAALFNCKYPGRTGVYSNSDSWEHSWVEQLADAGYHCINVGKMHTYPYDAPSDSIRGTLLRTRTAAVTEWDLITVADASRMSLTSSFIGRA